MFKVPHFKARTQGRIGFFWDVRFWRTMALSFGCACKNERGNGKSRCRAVFHLLLLT
jgi:hypothetical protein